jgi:hypothetical protein
LRHSGTENSGWLNSKWRAFYSNRNLPRRSETKAGSRKEFFLSRRDSVKTETTDEHGFNPTAKSAKNAKNFSLSALGRGPG